MSLNEVIQKVETLAREVVLREGCELYDIEFTSHSGQRVLRVYIDKAGGPVGVDDCANVSRGLNLLLDVEDVVPGGAYNLEVSSPGLERTLKKKEHFQKVLGQKVWMKLNRSLESLGVMEKGFLNAKQLTGVLQTVAEEQGVHLSAPPVEVDIPWEAIEKAKLVFEFGQDKRGK